MFGRKKPVEAPQPQAQAQSQPAVAQPAVAQPVQPPVQPPLQPAAAQGAPAEPAAAQPAGTPPVFSHEEAQRRAVMVTRQSLAFAQMVTLLLRSPGHRKLALPDLDWLIVPPLVLGQFVVAEAKAQPEGPSGPVAMVLWAGVSPDVDKRLSEDLAAPIRLRPEEWRSGDTLWLIEALGDPRVVSGILKQLSETAFLGRQLKSRQSGPDGKVVVSTLVAQRPVPATPPA